MKLTIKLLVKYNACEQGKDWFSQCGETDVKKVCLKLLSENRFNWANWLIARLLPKKDKTRYAIYAASLVIKNYEKVYPNDKRPREAIAAARKYLKSPTAKNKSAADSAARAADSAAYSAARAARAARAAYSAARAADSAAYSAARAADSAAILSKIVKFGIRLLK